MDGEKHEWLEAPPRSRKKAQRFRIRRQKAPYRAITHAWPLRMRVFKFSGHLRRRWLLREAPAMSCSGYAKELGGLWGRAAIMPRVTEADSQEPRVAQLGSSCIWMSMLSVGIKGAGGHGQEGTAPATFTASLHRHRYLRALSPEIPGIGFKNVVLDCSVAPRHHSAAGLPRDKC